MWTLVVWRSTGEFMSRLFAFLLPPLPRTLYREWKYAVELDTAHVSATSNSNRIAVIGINPRGDRILLQVPGSTFYNDIHPQMSDHDPVTSKQRQFFLDHQKCVEHHILTIYFSWMVTIWSALLLFVHIPIVPFLFQSIAAVVIVVIGHLPSVHIYGLVTFGMVGWYWTIWLPAVHFLSTCLALFSYHSNQRHTRFIYCPHCIRRVV
jgi:hypothetical protein